MIVAEDKMLSLSDDKTRIVADEGDPASTATLKASRDFLVTLRARVQRLIDEGKSEDEAVASKPTKDFDARWVHPGNFVTGDTMTRLAYQSLKGITQPTTPRQAYFVEANPSAHENSRSSSFGADTFLYVRTEVKGSTSAFGSMDVIRSSRTPGDVNLMRSRTVNWSLCGENVSNSPSSRMATVSTTSVSPSQCPVE